MTWSSSSASVATVSSTGLVTSVADGSATITATSGSASGTASVTVAQAAVRIELSDTLLSFLALGDTTRLTATVKDAAGSVIVDATVTWTTSAANVATVSSTGLVTSVADGTATLTATSGTASDTASVSGYQGLMTLTGTGLSVVVPSPSAPAPLFPQQYTSSSVVRPQL